MIVVIDNYDSFTYNLVQYLKIIGSEVVVFRNDAVSLSVLEEMAPAGFVISPGPGRPETAGISMPLIDRFSGKFPILGVCLGHQAIAAVMGGKVVSAKRLMHGKTSSVTADGQTI
ncbi:MAG: aminodeoxychorismate/anthranilate synthase component II, partial [Desulfobacterales bacterium]